MKKHLVIGGILIVVVIATVCVQTALQKTFAPQNNVYTVAEPESQLWSSSYEVSDFYLGIKYLLPREWHFERVLWQNGDDSIQINTMKDRTGYNIEIRTLDPIKNVTGDIAAESEQVRYYVCGEFECDLNKKGKWILIDDIQAFVTSDVGDRTHEYKTVLTVTNGKFYRFSITCKEGCDDDSVNKFLQGIQFIRGKKS